MVTEAGRVSEGLAKGYDKRGPMGRERARWGGRGGGHNQGPFAFGARNTPGLTCKLQCSKGLHQPAALPRHPWEHSWRPRPFAFAMTLWPCSFGRAFCTLAWHFRPEMLVRGRAGGVAISRSWAPLEGSAGLQAGESPALLSEIGCIR